jgi:hypothetical protein
MGPITVPARDVNAHLRAYRAQPLREYSNDRRHVYYVPSTKIYITVRGVGGGNVELEFTSECPCGYDD